MCLTFPRWDETTTGPEKKRAKEGLRIAQGEGLYPLRCERRYMWRDEALWEWPKAQTQTSTHTQTVYSTVFPSYAAAIHTCSRLSYGEEIAFWINPDKATTQVRWSAAYGLSDLQQIRCSIRNRQTAVRSNQQSHIWRIMTVQENRRWKAHSMFNEAAQQKQGERPTPKNSNPRVML